MGGRGKKMCVIHLDVIGRVCQFYYNWRHEIHVVTRGMSKINLYFTRKVPRIQTLKPSFVNESWLNGSKVYFYLKATIKVFTHRD